MTARKAAQEIQVQNAMGDAPTVATVVVQNKIDYTPKVSVIIPVYNVEKYLKQCLDSVLGQTLQEIEVICVDDGSTDSSMEILKDYAKQDNRVTILSQKNMHAGVARNAGLAVARGEYLSFLDSDDWFEIDMLNQMYAKAKKDKSDIVVCEYNCFDAQENRFTYKYKIKHKYLRKSPFKPCHFTNSLYGSINPAAWTKIFRRELFLEKGLRFEGMTSCNDITCVWVALSLANTISIINKPFVNYRVNTTTNISANRGKNIRCLFVAISKIEFLLKQYDVYDMFKDALYKQLKRNISYEFMHALPQDIIDDVKTAKKVLSNEVFNRLFEPEISIIIPVYNVEKYLKQCLDSVLKQRKVNLEVICIDDGSTDNSWTILQKYASKDPRVKIFKQQNKGVSAARNFGVNKAQAKYIHFIDSDDFIDEKLYLDLLPIIRKHRLDILMFGHWDYTEENCSESFLKGVFNRFKGKKIKQEDLIIYFLLACWNKIYRTDFIREHKLEFPEGVRVSEDAAFGSLCAICRPRFDFVNKNYMFYRRDNMSSVTHIDSFALSESLKAYDYMKENVLYKKAPKRLQYAVDIMALASMAYQISKSKDGLNTIDNGKEILTKHIEKMYVKWGDKIASNETFRKLRRLTYGVIPLVVAADENYAQPAAVSLYSVLQNTRAFVDIFVLADKISDRSKNKIKKSLQKFTNFHLTFVDMSKFDLQRFPKIERFNQAVFCRYFIPEICKDYDKVIYSDVDVLFCGDIQDYYNIDLNGYGLAAVSEESGQDHTGKYNHTYRKELFDIPMSHQYFANGNIIIDCKYWRENNITQKLVDLTKKWADKLVCPDLDVMNMVFVENYKRLEWKYCCCVHRREHIGDNKEMLDGFKNPFIIHFSGYWKPWNSKKCLFWRKYRKIQRKTAFKKRKKVLRRWFNHMQDLHVVKHWKKIIKSHSRRYVLDKIKLQKSEIEKIRCELVVLRSELAELKKIAKKKK